MICEKLPETRKEIENQLAKQNITGLQATALFLTGVGKQGCWNEQKVSNNYMMSIKSFIIEILDGLKGDE